MKCNKTVVIKLPILRGSSNVNVWQFWRIFFIILLIQEILHHLIGSFSHYLQGLYISSINSLGGQHLKCLATAAGTISAVWPSLDSTVCVRLDDLRCLNRETARVVKMQPQIWKYAKNIQSKGIRVRRVSAENCQLRGRKSLGRINERF